MIYSTWSLWEMWSGAGPVGIGSEGQADPPCGEHLVDPSEATLLLHAWKVSCLPCRRCSLMGCGCCVVLASIELTGISAGQKAQCMTKNGVLWLSSFVKLKHMSCSPNRLEPDKHAPHAGHGVAKPAKRLRCKSVKYLPSANQCRLFPHVREHTPVCYMHTC